MPENLWQDIVKRFKREVEGLYGENLEQIILFGSRARGDWEGASDVDLLVVLRDMDDFWAELRRLEAIAYQVSFGDGHPIVLSVIPIRAREFAGQDSAFVKNLRKEGSAVL